MHLDRFSLWDPENQHPCQQDVTLASSCFSTWTRETALAFALLELSKTPKGAPGLLCSRPRFGNSGWALGSGSLGDLTEALAT